MCNVSLIVCFQTLLIFLLKFNGLLNLRERERERDKGFCFLIIKQERGGSVAWEPSTTLHGRK